MRHLRERQAEAARHGHRGRQLVDHDQFGSRTLDHGEGELRDRRGRLVELRLEPAQRHLEVPDDRVGKRRERRPGQALPHRGRRLLDRAQVAEQAGRAPAERRGRAVVAAALELGDQRPAACSVPAAEAGDEEEDPHGISVSRRSAARLAPSHSARCAATAAERSR